MQSIKVMRKSSLRISAKKILLFFVGFGLLLLTAVLSFENSFLNCILAIGVMFFCILNMLKSKDNIVELFLHIQLFYFNYSVVFSRYLNIVDEFEAFYVNVDKRTYGIGIAALFIFELSFALFKHNSKGSFDSSILYAKNTNILISIVLLVACIIIGLLGFDRTLFGSRGASSAYYEYMGMLLILGLYYAGRNRLVRIAYAVSMSLFIAQGLLYGERIASLQFMIIGAFYFFEKWLQPKYVMLLCLAGILLMTFIGCYRSVYSLGYFSLPMIWDIVTERLFTFNGADLGYYCSLTFVMVADRVDWATRLELFARFILAIFIGNSNEANLTEFTKSFYSHWNGGFFPLYFYFYGGWIGTIVSCFSWAAFLSKCFKDMVSRNKEFLSLVGLYMVCFAARWYTYTPLLTLRPILLFSIAYWGLKVVNDTVVKAKMKKKF